MRPTLFMPAILGAAAAAAPAPGDEIVLRAAVRLASGATEVRLADVAELAGPLAEALADSVIAPAPTGGDGAALEIPLHQVRHALDALGVHWGKLQLSGRSVIVRPAAAPVRGADPPLAMTAAAVGALSATPPGGGPEAPAPLETAADLLDQDTLRGEIVRMITRGLARTHPASLRLVFDEHQEAILSMSPSSARFEIHPRGSFTGDRIALGVEVWQDGQVAAAHVINVRPLHRVDVPVLKREVRRGERIATDDLALEPRWLSTSLAAAVIDPDQVAGREAAARIKAGVPLRLSDLVSQIIIERGDRVQVRCLVGGLVVSLEAEARGSAARGEQVELRKLGERNTFFAKATAPGSAEIDLVRGGGSTQGIDP